jgi:hypothetical protein
MDMNYEDIRESSFFVLIVTDEYYTDPRHSEQLRYAVGMGKPIYILKEKDAALPTDDLDHNLVQAVEEFDGSDDESLERAALRMLGGQFISNT